MNHTHFLAPFLLLTLTGCAAGNLERFEFTHAQMGTVFRLVFYAPDSRAANEAARAATARIDQLNATLSDYIEESELSRLSRTAGSGRALPLSDDLWRVLQESQRIARTTDGAFDVTIGPLTHLWRRARRQEELTREDLLIEARRSVGYEKLILDAGDRTATLTVPGMRLDLGGIAKGYAADEALRTLREHGITRALVAAGGDVACSDPPPGESGWKIEVRHGSSDGLSGGTGGLSASAAPSHTSNPTGGRAASATQSPILLLKHAAISTSGDESQSVVIDGVRYSHILDPRTGLGLTNGVTVTVVAPRGINSDPWATAICVLGDEGVHLLHANVPGAYAIISYLHKTEEPLKHTRSGSKQ